MTNIWPGWKTVRLLGKGSYGSVYEIEKEEFGKHYTAALKVISIPQDEQELKSIKALGTNEKSIHDYFYASVEAVGKEFIVLNEVKGFTNIVSYEDHLIVEKKNTFGWDILIKMELLTPLEEYMMKHPMDEKDVCQLGIDLCEALSICQKKNIVHRDIKPANIFVNKIGNFKLGDFGIARTISKTQGTLSQKGTYNYMAPEIYLNKKYGYTVDIYSLGIVLYRLLNNNKLPFFEDRLTPGMIEEATRKRMDGETIPNIANVSSELSNIILKCIAYKPENRYQSAQELKKDLEKYLKNKEQNDVFIEAPTIGYEEMTTVIVEEPQMPQPMKQNSLGNITPQIEEPKPIIVEKPKPVLTKKTEKDSHSNILIYLAIAAVAICAILGYAVLKKYNDKEDNSSQNVVISNEVEEEPEIPEEVEQEEVVQEEVVQEEKVEPVVEEEKIDVESIISYTSEGHIIFGSYNGQPIEWVVLEEKEDGSRFLYSQYLLDSIRYNEYYGVQVWETSSLRSWLNNEFYKTAFSEKEKSIIQTTNVKNKANPNFGTDGGKDTKDKVFVLSIEEANKYLGKVVQASGYYTSGYTDWYWLRSPGYYSYVASRITYDGSIYEYDYVGGDDSNAIRPALWIQG